MRLAPGAAPCPFCPGSEGETPPEVDGDRPDGSAPDAPGWLVRVVPNRYPALPPAEGIHEVIVTTPRHLTRLDELTAAEAERAAGVWARRIEAAEADPRGLWPFLFLNQGAEAGASLQHTHAQLVAVPFPPPRLAARERAFTTAAGCPVCADLATADPEGRLVSEAGELAIWIPREPAFSAGIRIAPSAHRARFTDEADPGTLGGALRDVGGRVSAAFDRRALNAWIHQARPGGGGTYHWHADVVPRLGQLAGLELGAGVIAAARGPADLASRLRAG